MLKQLVRKGNPGAGYGNRFLVLGFCHCGYGSGAITLPVFYRDPWTDNYEEIEDTGL